MLEVILVIIMVMVILVVLKEKRTPVVLKEEPELVDEIQLKQTSSPESSVIDILSQNGLNPRSFDDYEED